MPRMDRMAHWHAIAAAQVCEVPRVPFYIQDGQAGGTSRLESGSVAVAHLEALTRWPEALHVDDRSVTLALPATDRTPFFAEVNAALHEAGLIVAWRDETYPVLDLASHRLLATFERAASRFWGSLTFGAHCNGYIDDEYGRPSHLWIARRAWTKATDPGRLDNLIGGGVPHGQTPIQTVRREGWEEAGLLPEHLSALRPGRILRLGRDIAEGFQLEEISVFDLALPAALQPCNQDGEVGEWMRLTLAEALERAADDEMTVDAALVTLDFALRHHLPCPGLSEALLARSAALWHGTTSMT